MLAGPETALGYDMMQLSIVGIGRQGTIQFGDGFGVHAGAIVTHPQKRTRLKVSGITMERAALSGAKAA